MGDDPKTSVTDRFCRLHDVKNVYLADAAPFVCGGTQNTTWSILAMAWRTMDFLKEDAGTAHLETRHDRHRAARLLQSLSAGRRSASAARSRPLAQPAPRRPARTQSRPHLDAADRAAVRASASRMARDVGLRRHRDADHRQRRRSGRNSRGGEKHAGCAFTPS